MAGRPKRKRDLVALNEMGEGPVAELLESALPIAEVCRRLGVGKRPLMEWLESDESRRGLLAAARARAAHVLADQALEIADGAEMDVPRDRLRVDTRKWLAARWNQAEYGDRPAAAVQLNFNDLHLAALQNVQALERVNTEPGNEPIEGESEPVPGDGAAADD